MTLTTTNLNATYANRIKSWFETRPSLSVDEAWEFLSIPANSVPPNISRLRQEGWKIKCVPVKKLSNNFNYTPVVGRKNIYVLEESP